MKKIILALLTFSLFYNCDKNELINENEIIEYSIISKGNLFGAGDEKILKQNVIIDNETDWSTLISKMDAVNNTSDSFTEKDIDFLKYDVIAIFDNIKSNGGYEYNVETNSSETITNVIIESIAPEGSAATVITQPYILIKINKSDIPIEFNFLEYTSTSSELEILELTGPNIGGYSFNLVKFLSDERLMGLEIYGGPNSLELNNEIQSFSLPNEKIAINLSEWDAPLYRTYIQQDYIEIDLDGNPIDPNNLEPNKINNWSIVSGTISFRMDKDPYFITVINNDNGEILDEFNLHNQYDLYITIENAVFENDQGEQILIKNSSIEQSALGWLTLG